MKYAHPDVLDNGPAHIRGNAARALLLPAYNIGMSFGQANAAALINVAVTSADFTMLNSGTGRKLRFRGAIGAAVKALAIGGDLHIAFTDGVGRILWVEAESGHREILLGQNYSLPVLEYLVPQPI